MSSLGVLPVRVDLTDAANPEVTSVGKLQHYPESAVDQRRHSVQRLIRWRSKARTTHEALNLVLKISEVQERKIRRVYEVVIPASFVLGGERAGVGAGNEVEWLASSLKEDAIKKIAIQAVTIRNP